jgi:predicted MPP superfamily phosphohydrolase
MISKNELFVNGIIYNILIMQNNIFGVLMFIAVSAFLILAHIFIYKSFIDCFNISNSKLQNLIKALLIIMPFVFIATIATVRSNPNSIIAFFYYLSGLWMGSLLIIAVFFSTFFITFTVINYFAKGLDYHTIGRYVFYFGLVISIFSIYHAGDTIVKKYLISSSSIPTSWNNKKVILVSDIHLGAVYKESFLKQVIKKINDQKPDLVLIIGDLFDGSRVDFSYVSKNLQLIKSKQGVYFVNGNHDGYFGTQLADELLSGGRVRVLKNEVVDIDGLQIIGIDYLRGTNMVEKLKNISKYDKNKYNVLLYHEPIQAEQNKSAGIDLQLAGHTHFGQIFPVGYLTKLLYGKYAYGLNKIEDFNIFTTSGVGGWGPAMRFGTDSEIIEFTLFKK